MRQIALDTETTGLDSQDDRIIEIAAIEIDARQVTDKYFYTLLNPEQDISQGAFEVHGISRQQLENEPLFTEKWEQLLEYVRDAEIFIHNAEFDLGFLNAELARMNLGSFVEETNCEITDTLKLARDRHPGMKNSLDEICKRYYIDISQRDKHNALLDAQLLAKAYLAMTGGQSLIELQHAKQEISLLNRPAIDQQQKHIVLRANEEEVQAHQVFIEKIRLVPAD